MNSVLWILVLYLKSLLRHGTVGHITILAKHKAQKPRRAVNKLSETTPVDDPQSREINAAIYSTTRNRHYVALKGYRKQTQVSSVCSNSCNVSGIEKAELRQI